MFIGVDYYPEHWPRARWKTDARMMRKAGFNIVRLAEFDWVNIEPSEGQYRFGMWDEALATLEKHGISAVMCTPTAAMPAWVPRKYPEVMAMQKEGTRKSWGTRKNNCFSSGTYRLLSERITRAMAQHFSRTPNVIGWQTDNEFGHPFCYCDGCRADFQDWLQTRYVTLAELNRAWGTHFWGHRVQDWAEIVIPVETGRHNPSACLDWQRFFSWQNVRFQRDQVRILRELCPRHFVTHNLMGLFAEIDYYDLSDDLDFVSWDNYPVRGKPAVRYSSSMAADLMRSLKHKNFWIMEQTAGPGGASTYGRNARPGEIRAVAYQQLARGCDGQVWFRWRTCTAGREQYWHGLLGHDGKGLRRYREAAQVATEYRKLARYLDGTTVKPRVAIIYDYDSLWATRIQPGFNGNDYRHAVGRYYNALFRAGVGVDMVRPGADLTGYRLVVAPELHQLPDRVADRLCAYVRNGGVLLADSRTGVKDETGLCHERTLPGRLSPALGIRIEEYESIADEDAYGTTVSDVLGGPYEAVRGADWVKVAGAQKITGYTDWHMKSYASVTRHRHGKGFGWYVGTVVTEQLFYDRLMAALLRDARVRPVVTPPEGVEVSVREGKGKRLLFLINHTEQKQRVTIPRGKRELIDGNTAGAVLDLPRHGVAVLKM